MYRWMYLQTLILVHYINAKNSGNFYGYILEKAKEKGIETSEKEITETIEVIARKREIRNMKINNTFGIFIAL